MDAETDRLVRILPEPESPPLAAVGEPFRRDGLVQRVAPFALGALLAELSIVLPPGPSSLSAAQWSIGLLLVTGAAFFLPFSRLPSWMTVIVPALYLSSVLALVLATGDRTSGLEVVLLIPLIWTALYHRPWESAVIVVLITVCQVITSVTPHVVGASDFARRVVFWLLVGAVVSQAVQVLRRQLIDSLFDERGLRRQTEALTEAAGRLTSILDLDEILLTATRVLAELSTIAGGGVCRSQYFEVHKDRVVMAFEYDRPDRRAGLSWSLSEQPWLADVIESRQACHGLIDHSRAGRDVRALLERDGVTHAVWVPVTVEGKVHGVLTLSGEGEDVSPRLFQLCTAVGYLTELALRNALTHELLREEATTDVLTGLPNRRGFEQIIAVGPREASNAVMVVDVDGLKHVNDTRGHEAGDAVLVAVANECRRVMRHGDVLARLGGDEFAAVLYGTTKEGGIDMADRMLRAICEVSIDGYSPSISIGIAWSNADVRDALAAADAAMYEAKQSGGLRWTTAPARA